MMHGMMMHGHGLHESWPIAWPLLALWILVKLAFWALILTGLVLLVRWLWRETSHRATPDNALEILKVRYARGELSRQEFEAVRRDLQ